MREIVDLYFRYHEAVRAVAVLLAALAGVFLLHRFYSREPRPPAGKEYS